MSSSLEFSYRGARSWSITAAITGAVLIEAVAVHLAVATRHPAIAWALSLTSIGAVVWLVRDYRALGTGRVQLDDERLRLAIGRRYDVSIPRGAIGRVFKPTFRDLPVPGTTQGRDYVNLTKPAAPNVLITLERSLRIRLPGGWRRDVQRLALTLDDPAAFLRAFHAEEVSV